MTVPYGGDMANPMATGESGPGVIGYVLGTLLIIAGIVGGGAFGVVKFLDVQDTVDDFERVPVDESETVELDEGDYVVYGQSSGGDAIEAVLAGFRIRPAEEGGDEIEVDRYEAEFTYDVDNQPLRAQFTFTIDDAGEYQVRADGIPSGATTAAIGPSIVGDFVTGIVGGLVIAGIGVLAGIVLLIVTGVRRRKFRQRNWQGGWGPGGGPGAWNPQPAPGYGAPPPPGGSWNPPPPPGGSAPTTF